MSNEIQNEPEDIDLAEKLLPRDDDAACDKEIEAIEKQLIIKPQKDTPVADYELKDGEYYLNNVRLPRTDVSFDWTPEMVAEMKKCKKNIRYFAENYFYITTLDEGKKKIGLYLPQKRILKGLTSYRYNIICSSRQAGKTTLMCVYALWIACFESDKRIIIVANKEKTAIMILRRIQLAYQQLPNWLKPGIKSWGGTEVIFGNDSSIAISTTTGSAVRGESVNVLIIDEMAHIENSMIDDFWGSVIPTICSSMKTKIFAVSTPKGTGNKFYEIFTQTERGELSEWHNEKIFWWEIPGRGKKWKKQALQALGGDEKLFSQEYENVFLETGDSAVDKDILNHFRSLVRDPLYIMEDGHYKIWKDPDPSHLYAVGVDVGEGIGKAASVATVLDVTDLTNIEQVATYHDNLLDPPHFAEKLNNLVNHWGRPPLLIERNNCGAEVINTLINIFQYGKVVAYNGSDDSTGVVDMRDLRPGIYSHTNSRYKGVANMRYWVNSLRVVSVYDIGIVHEMETFVRYPNGTWKKRAGNNIYDDRVMSLVWALFIIEGSVTEGYYEISKYDDRGKPLAIKPYVYESSIYFKLDKYYQRDDAPMPSMFGMKNNEEDGINDLMIQGWTIL